jgi:hypothetical protein
MSPADSSDTDSIHSSQSDADSTYVSQNYPPSEVKLMVHNRFSGIDLVSPAYAGEGVTCYLPPEQRVDAGSTMQTSFNIDLERNESISILLCKLERTNIDEFNEDEGACIQLLVLWNVDSFKGFRVVTYLIEHDKSRVWDRDMLMELAEDKEEELFDIQHCLVEGTWLIHDNIVLKTQVNLTREEEECCKLEVTVSEASIKDEDTHRPQYIDVDR